MESNLGCWKRKRSPERMSGTATAAPEVGSAAESHLRTGPPDSATVPPCRVCFGCPGSDRCGGNHRSLRMSSIPSRRSSFPRAAPSHRRRPAELEAPWKDPRGRNRARFSFSTNRASYSRWQNCGRTSDQGPVRWRSGW